MAGDGPDHLVKKAEREVQGIAAVERDKARRQEARDRLRAMKGDQRIGHPMAMAQQVDPCQGSAGRTGQLRFAMPGGAIHPEGSVYLSQYDPVIAEDPDPAPPPPRLGLLPQPGPGRFSRARLTDKQITLSVWSDPPPGVGFHTPA